MVCSGCPGGQTTTRQLTTLIEREGDMFVSLCPELDIASQGDSVEEARANLIEALELFFEDARNRRSSGGWRERRA